MFFFPAWCTCSFFHLHLCLTLCLNNSELSQRCRISTGGRNKLRLCARTITRVCWCFVVLFCFVFVFSAREVTFWHFVFNPSCLIKLDSCFHFTRILKGPLLRQFPDVINEFRRSTSNNEHGLFCEMTPSLSCTGQFLFSSLLALSLKRLLSLFPVPWKTESSRFYKQSHASHIALKRTSYRSLSRTSVTIKPRP